MRLYKNFVPLDAVDLIDGDNIGLMYPDKSLRVQVLFQVLQVEKRYEFPLLGIDGKGIRPGMIQRQPSVIVTDPDTAFRIFLNTIDIPAPEGMAQPQVGGKDKNAFGRSYPDLFIPVLDQAVDPRMCEQAVKAIRSIGATPLTMISGAGHDAMILAERVPATMIFLRSPEGVSHHPDESVRLEDIENALAAGLAFLRNLE